MSRNKFEGKCYLCGKTVEAGTGHFERHRGGWRVKHANVPGEGRVTCDMAPESVEFEDYRETAHPFSDEAFNQ